MYEVHRDGKVKQVKTLGWLLRHWKEVKSFDVSLSGNSFPSEYALTAFSDDWFFTTDYASLSMLHNWLNRPVFVGLPINWLSPDKVKIGSLEYAKLSPDISS